MRSSWRKIEQLRVGYGDDKGNGIPNASVTVQGSNKGTATDNKRTKQSFVRIDSDRTTKINVTYGSDKFILSIPQTEVDKSQGVLKQNPGY